MNNQNMSIWSQVEKTAPEATKSAKVNGQQITCQCRTARHIGGQRRWACVRQSL